MYSNCKLRSKIRFDKGSLKPRCYCMTGLQADLMKAHGCLHCVFSNFLPRQVSGRGVAFGSAAHGQSCPRIRRLDHSFSFGAVGGDVYHNSNGLGSRGPRGPLVWIRPRWEVPRDSLPVTVSTPFLLFNKSYWQAIKGAIHFLSPLILHSGWHSAEICPSCQRAKMAGSHTSLSQGHYYSHTCTILPVSRMCPMSVDSERRRGYPERTHTSTVKTERARPRESNPRPSCWEATVLITVWNH